MSTSTMRTTPRKYGNSKNPLSVGDVVIWKSEEHETLNYWPLGIIEKLTVGCDSVVRAAKV